MKAALDRSGYVEDVYACPNLQPLKRRLISTLKDAYDVKAPRGCAFSFGGSATAGLRHPLISTFPEAVQVAYRAEMAERDPIMTAAMTLGAPVQFSKMEQTLPISAATNACSL